MILILVILIAALSLAIFNQMNSNGSHDEAPKATNREVLANDSSLGSVEVIKNIGNPNGERIAYVVGVHPLENETHKTLLKLLPKTTDLNNCYDIYIINVTQDIGHYGDGYSDDSPGRRNGQNLAYRYVYPEILKGDYRLTLDVHSNVGAYEYKTFVFSPVGEGQASQYAKEVSRNSPNISYYSPDSTTSGPFLTIPLNENGIPAFYFEEYSFAPQDEKDEHMMELISAVDGLKYN